MSTKFGELSQIIVEAGTWVKLHGDNIVTSEQVEKTLIERKRRIIKYDERYTEMINEGVLLFDTKGSKVGQINSLTVMTVGEYSFGKPVKITANSFIGKNGVINVEREVEMFGSSHSKGILILNGYLGAKFAKDMPLSLTASICLEQLYNGIDGDSASSTELYALLSKAIGGVNEKIEGFFEICRNKGITGEQGVMIPQENIRNLNLNDEVIQAVKENKFHIYAVSKIDEGIEILTGVPEGDKNIPGTINYLVYKTLKKFAKASKENM